MCKAVTDFRFRTQFFRLTACLLFTIGFAGTSFSQHYNRQVPDSLVLSFVEWRLANDSIPVMTLPKKDFEFRPGILRWSKRDLDANSPYSYIYKVHQWLDTIFTAEDKLFLFEQSQSAADSAWPMEKKNPLAKKGHWFSYSIPVFSKNRTHVLLQELYYCGQTCGEGEVSLYRRTPDGWVLVYRGLIGFTL